MNQGKGLSVMKALRQAAVADSSRSINELRVIVALERAIARIENEPVLAKQLVFKGGFVLFKLIESPRFTRDVDALAFGLASRKIPSLMESALASDLDDGFWYGDLKSEPLEHQGDYKGVRFSVAFQIGEIPVPSKFRKMSRIQIDIGFGDELSESPKKRFMKSVIPSTQPVSWLVYPLESMFAEKLQTLFVRGSANSRARDVFDLVLLHSKCSETKSLMAAIRKTFETRKTPLPLSFSEGAKCIDLTILRAAWPSVELPDPLATFDEHWAKLVDILGDLDRQQAR